MKKLSIVSASVLAFAALAVSAPAQAAVVDVSGVARVTNNVRVGQTDQDAWAVDINVGSIANSNIDTAATNLTNMDSVNATIDQSVDAPTDIANISLAGFATNNLSFGAVDQLAVAVTGSGGVTGSNLNTSALNGVNLSVGTITVKQ